MVWNEDRLRGMERTSGLKVHVVGLLPTRRSPESLPEDGPVTFGAYLSGGVLTFA